ncbi:hypothetical protein V7152_00815 [Neobacillus drentensis]|uniref:hypothetical protein n=1 Tax=Neobacillus drentensis TaxID=220684 RepID=UPI002FFD8681
MKAHSKTILLILEIVLIASNFRFSITSVSPLIEAIVKNTGMSNTNGTAYYPSVVCICCSFAVSTEDIT